MTPFLVWYGHAPAGAPQRVVSGLALVRRAVLSAQAAGFERIVVAVRETDLLQVRAGLAGDKRIRADVSVLEVPAQPSTAVEHVLPAGEGEVVVALGDRVWVPAVLRELLPPLAEDRDVRVLCADEGEQTDEEPSGLARVRAAQLDRLPLGRGLAFGAAAKALGGPERVERRVVGRKWRAVRVPGDVRDAETLLLRALIKPADGVVARNINRRISTMLSRYLARRSITPNNVSTVVLLIGICSGPCSWQGGWLWMALGGLCYYVSSVLDGCDGELARLKYLSSPVGIWVDTIVDDVVGLSFLVGLYHGLDRGWGHPYWGWLGIVVVACYVLMVLPRYWLFVARIGVGDHQKLAQETRPTEVHGFAKFFLTLKENIFRIDFLTFAAMATSVLGVPFVFAAVYVPCSVGAFVDTLFVLWRYRRKPAPSRA
jgi:phosphatidylglycerophosphate synthase